MEKYSRLKKAIMIGIAAKFFLTTTALSAVYLNKTFRENRVDYTPYNIAGVVRTVKKDISAFIEDLKGRPEQYVSEMYKAVKDPIGELKKDNEEMKKAIYGNDDGKK